jgi:DNA-binding XRE family transcriptional regulator/quercetin dioxygenase-like cupin family protein
VRELGSRIGGVSEEHPPRNGDLASGDGSDEMPRRLRDARERSGMSLRTLAKRLDISASALSQIETGKSRPSVRTLYAVVSELGISLDDLFDNHRTGSSGDGRPAGGGGDVVVGRGTATDWMTAATSGHPMLRKGDRPTLELDTGVQWERLTAEHDPMIDFLSVSYDPGSASNAHGKLVRHAGREYGVVLSGTLDVTVGFETYSLAVGDSISFSSDEPHVLANNGQEQATAIWFVVGRRQSDPRKPLFDDPAMAGEGLA